MNLAYFDTASGIAGDMTLCALVDAGASPTRLREKIDSLGMPGVELRFTETIRHCFRALRLDVVDPGGQTFRGLNEILAMLAASKLDDWERDIAQRIFRRLGNAEAKVHGLQLDDVHFHEVGAVDSIVDIVGVAVALADLKIEKIIAAPPALGSGMIHIAHGPVSVPAPATVELLRGLPVRQSDIQCELTTPTGAAILATLADGFGSMPDMRVSDVGYGAGHKDFPAQANLLRVVIGQAAGRSLAAQATSFPSDEVMLLETNLDDVSGEQVGFAIEQLWDSGALDVFTTAIAMKKNRPGILLSVITSHEQVQRIESTLFRATGSLGIRRQSIKRSILPRELVTVETRFGPIQVKVGWRQDKSGKSEYSFAPEYEDCRLAAKSSGESFNEVFLAANLAAREVVDSRSPHEASRSEHRLGAGRQPTSTRVGWAFPKDPNYHPTDHSHDHSHDHHDHHHH